MIGCFIFSAKEHALHSEVMENLNEKFTLLDIVHHLELLIVYVKIESKVPVWQFVLELELQGMITAYGFGEEKRQAKKDALRVLRKRLEYIDIG